MLLDRGRSSASAAREVQFLGDNVEILEIQVVRVTTTDEIQQAKLVESRSKPCETAVNAPVEQVLPVTHVQAVERSSEKTAEILQGTVH